MNRITKVVYFSILFIVAIGQLVIGNSFLGLGLIVLLVLAVQWFEKREARRQFYRALRKLYVCVDSHAYGVEIEKLKRNRLIKKYSANSLQLLEAILFYYVGRRDEAKTLLLQIEDNHDFDFWKHCYLLLIQLNRDFDSYQDQRSGIEVESTSEVKPLFAKIVNEVKQVPSFFSEIAEQRLAVLELMLKDNLEIDEIEHMRDSVNYNLLMAELTKIMVIHASNEHIKKYYQKGVINLSKGLTI